MNIGGFIKTVIEYLCTRVLKVMGGLALIVIIAVLYPALRRIEGSGFDVSVINQEITQLFGNPSYSPYYTIFIKLLTGGMFFIFYLLEAFAKAKELGKGISMWDVLGLDIYLWIFWGLLSTINAAIPMYNPTTNYILIPSGMTLIYALGATLYKTPQKKRNNTII